MSTFLATAWQIIVQTASYLLAYNYVLILAPAAHLALVLLGPERRGWLSGRRGPLAAVALGLTEPLSTSALERNLRLFASPGSAVVYLGVSHALNVYSWILLGPLLGRDFLFSHLVGVLLFVSFATALLLRARITVETSESETPQESRSARNDMVGAAKRFVRLAILGLGIAGLVAGWGLSRSAWAPADLGTGGPWTQISNGALGISLALLGIPPVANLFVGTYLWKIGLAHAGIVAYFCAATAAPMRWRLYSRVYGRRGASRLVVCLLAASLLTGLLTAWVFGALDLTIHYKLLPQQLWQVP